MDKIYTDIAVLGGGASGLCAAINAARELKKHSKSGSVTIVEKKPRVGKKLLATGNGRCNLAHEPLDAAHYHGDSELAQKILAKSKGYEDFFNSLGLFCRTDGEGRVYPYSQTASSVLDALRLECAALGITERLDFNCVRIEPLIEGYKLVSENAYNNDDGNNPKAPKARFISARRLIIACGGVSGADGDGGNVFKLIKNLGIEIAEPFPSLCPVNVPEKMTRSVKGLRAVAKCSAILDGKTLKSETGEVQFGEGYLSGICVLNLSRFASLYGSRLTLSLDLVPEISLDKLLEFIFAAAKIRATSPLEDLLSGLLHKRFGALLIKQITELPLNQPCNSIKTSEAEELAFLIKDWRFPVLPAGTGIWQTAQCTAGGVCASELTGSLMLKKKQGLFIVGEAVNVDGDCGGYNLAWAWASGEVAGIAAAGDLIDNA